MTEYLIVGIASAVIAWLAYRNLSLEKRLAALEASFSESELANPAGLQESVAQLIEELKAAADSACDGVAQRIDDLRRGHEEVERKYPEAPVAVQGGTGVPVSLITKLAKKGLDPAEIARQAKVTQGEVELTLRFHQKEGPAAETAKRKERPKTRPGKEIAVA